MLKELVMSDSNISLEQLEGFLDSFELSDAKRRKIASRFGHDIPEPPPPELSEQLQEVCVKRGHVGKATKRNPNPQPVDYVVVPSLKLDGTGTKGFWVNTRVARAVAKRILAVCEAEGIE